MFQGVAETQKGTHKDEHSLFPYKIYLYQKINGPVFGLEKDLYLTYFTRFLKNKKSPILQISDQFCISSSTAKGPTPQELPIKDKP